MPYDRFTAQNAVALLVDHQVGTVAMVRSLEPDTLKKNAALLANVARILGLPVVLTSSMEDHEQGPIIAEIEAALPHAFAARLKRAGLINAMEDPAVAAALRASERRHVILAGVTNDVCTVLPALTLVGLGMAVQVVADAGGSPTKMGDELALRRMEQAGVTLTGINQLVAELVGDWSTDAGRQVIELIREQAA